MLENNKGYLTCVTIKASITPTTAVTALFADLICISEGKMVKLYRFATSRVIIETEEAESSGINQDLRQKQRINEHEAIDQKKQYEDCLSGVYVDYFQ